MICPVCHTEIPEGSNICPHCYADLIKTQQNRYHKPAKTSGPTKINPQALIVAGGLFIVLLVLVIVLVRFMFSGSSPDPTPQQQQPGGAQAQPSPEQTQFAVFGEPVDVVVPTLEPVLTPIVRPTPAPPAEPSYVSLNMFDLNDQVKMVQTALVSLGYLTDKADGIFGANTETAVKAFQKANNLKDDGIAGAQTQSALFKQYYSSGAAQPQAQAQTQAPVSNEQVPNLPG